MTGVPETTVCGMPISAGAARVMAQARLSRNSVPESMFRAGSGQPYKGKGEREMSRIGYTRVSTAEQHPEAQAARLREAGARRIFTDHGVSGRLASRPGWDECLAYLRPGDTLIVVRLDRIGRSLRNLLDVVSDLGQRGVDLIVLDQQLDTSTPSGRLVFSVLAALSEFEADLIRERTMDGLAAARARGRNGGRPAKLTPRQVEIARTLYAAGGQTVAEIGQALGAGRSTVYRALNGGKAVAR